MVKKTLATTYNRGVGLFSDWRAKVSKDGEDSLMPPPPPTSNTDADNESATDALPIAEPVEPETEPTANDPIDEAASDNPTDTEHDEPADEDSDSMTLDAASDLDNENSGDQPLDEEEASNVAESSDTGDHGADYADVIDENGSLDEDESDDEADYKDRNEVTLTDPLVGMVIDDRYQIEWLLARGGMATVYVAYDRRLERPVAVKVMHPHLAESTNYVNHFRREARSAARIIHPAVVTVFDQGIVEGSGYLVMELVQGTNLRSLLNEQGALTLNQALSITVTVLQALSAAHAQGVIHRDIKPENVLVPKDGSVKVADFGLAGAASDVSAATTGSVMGTVAYLPPELAAGESADPRSDLFSLGIMLYEMLTGDTPFEDMSVYQTVKAYAEKDIPPPSNREPWIPSEVDDFVCSLVSRSMLNRPQSAREALEQLVRIHSQVPASLLERRADVEPSIDSERTDKIKLRGETISLPATPTKPTQSVRTQPAQPQKRRRAPLIIATIITLLIAAGGGFTWWWFEYGPGSYIDVPAIAGAWLEDGQSKLDALNLQSVVEEHFDDVVPAGIIIDTRPSSDERVHKAGIVTILLSKGVEMVEVPDLVNKSAEEIDAILTGAKLTRGDTEEAYDEDIPEGSIISQSIDAGESVKHDSAIDVVVSLGREPIPVPSVVGLSKEEAQQLISDAGLQVQATEEFSDDVAKGVVISQDPAAKETLHRTDPVAIVVSKGPETVTIPNVIRMSEDEATAELEALGLKVQVDRVFLLVDMVAAVDPEVGTQVKVGSTVKIRVV